MKISLAFLLFFVTISTQQRLQTWNYWAPQQQQYQESFPSPNIPYYYPFSNDESFQSRSYFASQESSPPVPNDEYRISNYETNSPPSGEFRKLPFLNEPSASSNNDNSKADVESRFFLNLLNNNNNNNNNNGGGLSNIVSSVTPLLNPFAYGYSSNLPVIANPNTPDLISSGAACMGTGGEPGICIPSSACSLLGKTTSGTCGLGTGINSCCINVVNKCEQTISDNNTFWRSPTDLSSVSSCSLTVKLSDTVQAEKRRPICQVRLDFIRFTTAQPNEDSVCEADSFTVSIAGDTHIPGPICGDNDGQHMYLHVPSSAIQATDIKLSFSLKSDATVPKSWNIQIGLLPCGALYLAPVNCLQWFTPNDGKGQIKSFNWKDNPALLDPEIPAPTRQLADQHTFICIRPQLASSRQICYSACSESSFIVSTNSADGDDALNRNQQMTGDCNNDFLIIPSGSNPGAEFDGITQPNFAERYCGERLSSDPPPTEKSRDSGTTNQMVCSDFLPFHIFYGTNGDEMQTAQQDILGRGNQGFCINFFQR